MPLHANYIHSKLSTHWQKYNEKSSAITALPQVYLHTIYIQTSGVSGSPAGAAPIIHYFPAALTCRDP